ncbi:MAG TPA: DUF4331 family protein [Candidatus Eremiobacteraceae bacterium]|jgi:hypothetical protein
MRNTIGTIAAVAVIIAAAVGCSHTSSTPRPPTVLPYQQIERLSRPAIKEVFESFASHDATNRSTPNSDATLQTAVSGFMTGVAGRDAATTNALVSILFPDEMKADMSVNLPAGGSPAGRYGAYLGIETGGATGNTFGGRWLNDDAVKISLGAIFGNTLAALGVVPDDGHEAWCLSDDNLSNGEGAFQSYGNSFPYVNAPY